MRIYKMCVQEEMYVCDYVSPVFFSPLLCIIVTKIYHFLILSFCYHYYTDVMIYYVLLLKTEKVHIRFAVRLPSQIPHWWYRRPEADYLTHHLQQLSAALHTPALQYLRRQRLHLLQLVSWHKQP